MVRKNKQSGQIALISLLVLMVATTVGLSLIARSTTDVAVTRNVEESSRAFSAAEAGIEEGLKSGVGSAVTIDSALGVKYSVAITSVGGNANSFEFPQKTLKEDVETVWLVNHDPSTGLIVETPTYTANTIGVCWSSESPHPAVVVSVLYRKFGGSYQVAKAAYDPDSRSNNFSAATVGGCTANTAYSGTITFSPDLGINPAVDTLIALRIRPVYSGARIAVAPAQILPGQGSSIESTGTSGSDVNRKIVAYKQYRAPASLFDYAVYSEGSFSQ